MFAPRLLTPLSAPADPPPRLLTPSPSPRPAGSQLGEEASGAVAVSAFRPGLLSEMPRGPLAARSASQRPTPLGPSPDLVSEQDDWDDQDPPAIGTGGRGTGTGTGGERGRRDWPAGCLWCVLRSFCLNPVVFMSRCLSVLYKPS